MRYIGITSELPYDLDQLLSDTGNTGKEVSKEQGSKNRAGSRVSGAARKTAPPGRSRVRQDGLQQKKTQTGEADGDSELFYSEYENRDNLQLPDFTRTYGFDFQPDVKLYKKPKKQKPLTRKQKLKAFKKRLDKKFSKKTKTGGRYGIQRYTKYTGSSRVGIGYKLKKDGRKTSITFHKRGLGVDREDSSRHRKYFLGIDRRAPTIRANQKESTYMYFGIKLQW